MKQQFSTAISNRRFREVLGDLLSCRSSICAVTDLVVSDTFLLWFFSDGQWRWSPVIFAVERGKLLAVGCGSQVQDFKGLSSLLTRVFLLS